MTAEASGRRSLAGATLLVANRGEIAVRVIETARSMGVLTVAVYAEDDAQGLAVTRADAAVALPGVGARAYLDGETIVAAALSTGASLVHPGYGFLSEDPVFAKLCAAAGLTFVGPSGATLSTFGDKTEARRLATSSGVPVLQATDGRCDLEQARSFLAAHPRGIMLKAVAGGGGRGMAPVRDPVQLEQVFDRCAGEAEAAFGRADLFAESLFERARHIEVQLVAAPTSEADTRTTTRAIGDRDCSVQRRRQKVVETAPARGLGDSVRRLLHESAVRIGAAAGYVGIGTVEFLVRGDEIVFLELNPRIQVEHTVTECVADVDLVEQQLLIASGASWTELELPTGLTLTSTGEITGAAAEPGRTAIQVRVNAEQVGSDGNSYATAGLLEVFEMPSGEGVRVDTHGYPGLEVGTRYDSLLAKVITFGDFPEFGAAVEHAAEVLQRVRIETVGTNVGLLGRILADGRFRGGSVTTEYLGDLLPGWIDSAPAVEEPDGAGPASPAVLRSPMLGTVIEIKAPESTVVGGESLVVLEAMKMYHALPAPGGLEVVATFVVPGDTVEPGEPLLSYEVRGDSVTDEPNAHVDLDASRADLTEMRRRHQVGLDDQRGAAVAKLHARGRRSTRENIADLIDDDSFVEYGQLTIAAQRSRRDEDDLIANTPADGMVTGLATVNADHFGADASEVVVMAYDYTVLAGTQGVRNHQKSDRMFGIAREKGIPVVMFPEGGGGRPGDVDKLGSAGLEVNTFHDLGKLSGHVPLVGVVSGRCFAGNAALLGMCDVVIATPDVSIGMGGPAMIEGGGLGVHAPDDVGPIDVQSRNGVVHVMASDEADAVSLAQRYLGYFQGAVREWTAPDPRLSRHVVPEDRLLSYDPDGAIRSIVDVDSELFLRTAYGVGIITALARVEGRPLGVFASNTRHLGGAIDAESADKLDDFLALCDAFGLPVLSLCDTPGFMVGPEAEKTATVRRFSRLFISGARLRVPVGVVVLRKAYGLGAMAMAAGSFRVPRFAVSWPTGELGPMGLEGAVRLGFRKELEAAADAEERTALFDSLLAQAYAHGAALHTATSFELDDVIDPADTRTWIRTLW